jgi:pimeloyl-ACP methyl ester carboxylesterase
MDIFIGGAADDVMPGGGVMRGYARSYGRETGRPTRYLPNGRIGRAEDAIRQGNADGGPVNVVGHSWGGPDAYNAVARARRDRLRVDNLITLDPVRGPGGALEGAEGAGAWMNVYASPTHPDYTDWITNFGPLSAKPSNLPTQQADEPVNVNLSHGDVDGMMEQSGARAVLDRSRQLGGAPSIKEDRQFGWPPSVQDLHDNLPMMDWIRRREAELRSRGATVGRTGRR